MQTLPVSPNRIVIEPREYQAQLVAAAREAIRAQKKRILLQLPTGGGKTVVASLIIQGAVQKQKRILFLAHRRELIDQPSAKLDEAGINHGVIMAKHWRYRPQLPVQVASVQTLVNRELAHDPDLIFIDECHRVLAKSYTAILDRYPNAITIGLTATPVRTDGRGLGNVFDHMICGPSVAVLTEQGYLVPTRVFAPGQPDLSKVKKTAGEYNTGGLQRAMDKPTITGDIVSHWLKLAENRITIAFATGVEHSQHLRDSFLAAGVTAGHLDGKTDPDERVFLQRSLAQGSIRVLCSVGVLTEGVDIPVVSCIVLARPTCSTGLFLQMLGRGMRPAAGKTDMLVLDHAGCTLQHGFVDDEREWSLDIARPHRLDRIDTSLDIKVCPRCRRVSTAKTRICPTADCGYVFSIRDPRKGPEVIEGELQEVRSQRINRFLHIPTERREDMFRAWVAEGLERGYKKTYAWGKYYGMFGEAPKTEWMLEATLEMRKVANLLPGELVGI